MSDEIRAYLKFFEEMGFEQVRTDLPVTDLNGPDQAAGQNANLSSGEMPSEIPTNAAAPQRGLPPASQLGFHIRAAVMGDPETAMKEVRDDLGDCVRCKLHRYRTNIVFGTGGLHAELMFVGEAPGADEDEQGIPFVGRAGQLLTKIIESIGLRREDVYIANVIKCRPPQNRNPEPDEVEKCRPFLFRQIDTVQPKIICALGKFAAQTLLDTATPITQLRGRFFDKFGIKVIPTFHPSYLLRNPAAKREVWEDMKAIRRMLDQLKQS